MPSRENREASVDLARARRCDGDETSKKPLRKLGKVAISEDPKPEDRPDDRGLRLDTAVPSSLRRPSMKIADPKPVSARVFEDAERQALYDRIQARRDVRNEFLPDEIEPDALRASYRRRTTRHRLVSCSRGISC